MSGSAIKRLLYCFGSRKAEESHFTENMSEFELSKFTPAPQPELICGICMGVLEAPYETPCRHVFCRHCIFRALRGKRKCPICRAPCTRKKCREVVPLVQQLINNLTMRCNNFQHGCTELIRKERFLDHIKTCSYAMVQCRLKGCGRKLLEKDRENHERSVCPCRGGVCLTGCVRPAILENASSYKCMKALVKAAKEKNNELQKRNHEPHQVPVSNPRPDSPVAPGGNQEDDDNWSSYSTIHDDNWSIHDDNCSSHSTSHGDNWSSHTTSHGDNCSSHSTSNDDNWSIYDDNWSIHDDNCSSHPTSHDDNWSSHFTSHDDNWSIHDDNWRMRDICIIPDDNWSSHSNIHDDNWSIRDDNWRIHDSWIIHDDNWRSHSTIHDDNWSSHCIIHDDNSSVGSDNGNLVLPSHTWTTNTAAGYDRGKLRDRLQGIHICDGNRSSETAVLPIRSESVYSNEDSEQEYHSRAIKTERDRNYSANNGSPFVSCYASSDLAQTTMCLSPGEFYDDNIDRRELFLLLFIFACYFYFVVLPVMWHRNHVSCS
ncbi:hypothetical protein BsWGS_25169 [Bradybaena similaris]